MGHSKFVILIIMVVLGLSSLLALRQLQPTALAQSEPAAAGRVHLPLVWGKGAGDPTPPTPSPTPTPQPVQIKQKSGIHMGNRGSDWQDGYFTRLQGKAEGKWPAAVVVLSDQLYIFGRYNTPGLNNPLCRVNSATIKSPRLYQYLTDAIKQGTKVVIRIHPSPGNFIDHDVTPNTSNPKEHRIRTDEAPAGGDYCPDAQQSQQSKIEAYRDIRDIVNEMKAIYELNTNIANQWPPDGFYFEPANEPNYEWYQRFKEIRGIDRTLIPEIDNSEAWANMDAYFGALITLSRAEQQQMQVLTPAMSQAQRAERRFPGSCNQMTVLGGVNGQSGYDFMPQTYLSDQAAGYSWHNYWDIDHENWEIVSDSIERSCLIMPAPYQPQSHHVSQYFSYEMRNYLMLTQKPSFITEADLNSPCQNRNSPPADKTAATASQSLQNFIRQEQPGLYGKRYVTVWLLVNEYEGGNECGPVENPDVNYEINWHEAYDENGNERSWFTAWWLGDE